MTRTIIAVFAVTSIYVGCAEEETDPPRPRSDAGSSSAGNDAGGSTPDAGTSTPTDASGTTDTGTAADTSTGNTACTTYCACMTATCAGKLSDCATQCAAGSTWDVSCRTTHCNLAKSGDTTLHCGHAAGESTCQ